MSDRVPRIRADVLASSANHDRATGDRALAALAAAWAALVLLAGPARAQHQGIEIGFVEDFALSTERDALLDRLIPGTADFYYYHCLHAQHIGDLDAVPALLEQWRTRHGVTGRHDMIQQRQVLLLAERDPNRTYDQLVRELGLSFDHRPEVPGERESLPTVLDTEQVSRAAFAARAFAQHPRSLDGLRTHALADVVTGRLAGGAPDGAALDDARLDQLLQRLDRADLPGIVDLVAKHLDARRGRSFGSLEIHARLSLAQLEELARRDPDLLTDGEFVGAWLRRLAPAPDEDVARHPDARLAHLVRLAAFVAGLPPTFDSLKAQVLYHRLQHDLSFGRVDDARLRAYLALPVRHPRYGDRFERSDRRGDALVSLAATYPTGLPAIGNDDALVRACLAQSFRNGASFESYTDLLDRDWVARLYAETKILWADGTETQAERERWYTLLDDPGYYEQLERRVDLEFPPIQRTFFDAAEVVTIALDVKNVETLLVKVFRIDAVDWFAANAEPVPPSIDLDGLVAGIERTHTYDVPALRTVRRSFTFEELTGAGTWVVEFIGNGSASRVVVRKGDLHLSTRTGAAGHVLTVFDETGRRVTQAQVQFAGRRFTSDANGEIAIPFTTDPGTRSAILIAGERTALATFEHAAENYTLEAGVFVEREALIDGRNARLLVRPRLLVNGALASPDLLEDPVLHVEALDLDGTRSTSLVRDPELTLAGEFVHEIGVPARLVELRAWLTGSVSSAIGGDDHELTTAPATFQLNGIDAAPITAALLLSRSSNGYHVDLLGKNGEPRGGAVLTFSFEHADFTDAHTAQLETDANGRVDLGALDGIATLRATEQDGRSTAWRLEESDRSLPSRVHGLVGETLRVPHPGGRTQLVREEVSFVELRSGVPMADRFDRLALNRRYIEMRGLAPGVYRLRFPLRNWSIDVHVAPGTRTDGWATGGAYALELSDGLPLQLADVRVVDQDLVVQLDGAGPNTRVHVWATRYLPAYDAFDELSLPPITSLDGFDLGTPRSDFHAERDIGDELRYILARRLATVYPGTMLKRPSLLLNPWDVGLASQSFKDTIGLGGGGGGGSGKMGRRRGGRAQAQSSAGALSGEFANLDFLPFGARVVPNRRPDDDGVVRVALADLGRGQHMHVVVCDTHDTIQGALALDELPLEPRDLRLTDPLDPSVPMGESRGIEVLRAGETAVVSEGESAELNDFRSLAAAHTLLSTLLKNSDALARFEFLTRWPSIDEQEQRALYSEHACHELHLFLFRKDPAFFDAVVRPYLANKRAKTFLDHWLLGDDLTAYLDPWSFSRLNVLERILLTRRIAERTEDGRRHVRELLATQRPDQWGDVANFGALLAGASLDAQREVDRGGTSRGPGDIEVPRVGSPPTGGLPPKPGAPQRRPTENAADRSAQSDADEPMTLEGAERELAEMRDELEDLGYLTDDARRRDEFTPFYRPVDATRTWAEHNYFHLRIAEHDADVVQVDRFWNDFAQWDGQGAFLSPHFSEAASGVNEALLALAVLDLPFEAGALTKTEDGSRLEITSDAPLLLARRELRRLERAADAAPILVSQNVFATHEPMRYVDGQARDRFVTEEFLVATPYTCRVVVTNPTSSERSLELLLQIPEGAMPIAGDRRTRGLPLSLSAYGTANVEFSFYFPAAGKFVQYPAQVSEDEAVVASAEARTFPVRNEPTVVDTASWEYVSQRGTLDDVLAHLDSANLAQLDLTRIAWRMRDRAAFDRVLAALRARLHYAHVLWSYGLHHRATRATTEYLEHRTDFLARCGRTLDSPLVTIDPVERRTYEHLEFAPFVNARAHQLRERPHLTNVDVSQQYHALLDVLAQTATLDSEDRLAATYYLLLQDRIGAALEQYALVDPAAITEGIQYDYLTAYLAFFTDDPTAARPIAERYLDHPVERWRERFAQVVAHLDEASGAATGIVDDADDGERNTQLASAEPALEMAVEGRRVRLNHANLEAVEIGYYPMDVEVLFSSSPFVQGGSAGAFSYVEPLRRDTLSLSADGGRTTFELPAEYANSNLLVEVRAGALVRRETVFAGSLAVQWMDNYGQVRVTHAESGDALSKVYVKVYAKEANGSVRFHKDGYTDLRGRFDYATVSGEDAAGATRFAVLVLSAAHGASIREVAPPPR